MKPVFICEKANGLDGNARHRDRGYQSLRLIARNHDESIIGNFPAVGSMNQLESVLFASHRLRDDLGSVRIRMEIFAPEEDVHDDFGAIAFETDALERDFVHFEIENDKVSRLLEVTAIIDVGALSLHL